MNAANWFIALPVTPGPWFQALTPPPAVRLFAPTDLHLTVAFLGAASETRALAAFELAADFPLAPLEVRLGALEGLGGKRRPSAFSALLTQGRDAVEMALGTARSAMWERAGARADTRPPLAHVTLARPQRKATEVEVAHALAWARALDLGAPSCTLTTIALYTWSEDRSQTLFRRTRELPLREA
ncbi:MAG: hypothetical protein ABW321_30210 [Polyangiales bacterium]